MDRKIAPKKGLRRKHIPYVAGGLLFIVMPLWIVLGQQERTLRVDAQQLTIHPVTQALFHDYVRLSGQATPLRIVQLAPEIGGIVAERVTEEGQAVRKGDIIVRLTNSDLDLQILSAEADLAEKQNLLRNTQIAMQQDRLNNETERASLDMDVQRKERIYRQNRRLYDERLIAREIYEQSREDYELAQQKQRLITERLKQDGLYRKAQMEQMEENLANMRRNLLLVRGRKDRLEVRAPIDGELGLLNVELGQNIAAGQQIGQVNDLAEFKIEARIDERYIDRVKTGLPASFERNEKTYRLRVRKIYPEVKEGMFRIDLVFVDERPDNIRSGLTYNLNLELGKSEEAILIPRGTFFQSTGGRWIFVLDKEGKKAFRRNIIIRRQNPQYYEIVEGLEPGEQVIVSGYETFKESEVLKL